MKMSLFKQSSLHDIRTTLSLLIPYPLVTTSTVCSHTSWFLHVKFTGSPCSLHIKTELNKQTKWLHIKTELNKQTKWLHIKTELNKQTKWLHIKTELNKQTKWLHIKTELNKQTKWLHIKTELNNRQNGYTSRQSSIKHKMVTHQDRAQ